MKSHGCILFLIFQLLTNNTYAQILKKNYTKEDYYHAFKLRNMSDEYSKSGKFDEALKNDLIVAEIFGGYLGKKNQMYANALDCIASDYCNLGDYVTALSYDLMALEIINCNHLKHDLGYGIILNNTATVFSGIGENYKALEYTIQALSVIKNFVGNNTPEFAGFLTSSSVSFSRIGNYSEALEMNMLALDICNRTLDKSHPTYLLVLNNLANNYASLGNYLEALLINIEVTNLRKQTLGTNHPDYTTSLNNSAFYYSQLGEYSRSLQLNLEVLKIVKKKLGKNHPHYAQGLNNIAVNYSDLMKYKQSLKYHKESLLLNEKIYGSNNRAYVLSLNNIAGVYFSKGDYKSAIEFFSKVIRVEQENGGRDNSIYENSLSSMALLLAYTRDLARGANYQKQSYTITESSFELNRFGLDKMLLLINKKKVDVSFHITCSLLSRDSSLSHFASRSWINLNGIVGSEASNLESQIESSGDTALVHLMDDLKLNKKQLAKYRELTKEEKSSRGIDEKALEDEVSKHERELSKQSKAFADFNRRFNLKDLSSALKGDEVFVDIARVPYFSTYTNQWTDSVKYLVFIHDAKDTLVDYRFIDNGKELEGDVFADYKIDCSNQANATDLKNALYYNSFWKPIADKIGSSKTVYVSLGGVYNNINLNTLYNPETGKYLVEETDIRIVNNARDFILSKEQTERTYTSTSTALYGFPDYDGIETTTKDTTDYLALTRDLDPLWIDSLTRGGLKAAPLPATKVEVEQIAKSFKENGWQVSEYLGDKASETNIKQEASPRVLHIATHGYFFDDIPMDKNNSERFLGLDRQQVVQDPMLRSGLLFTGANKTLHGEKIEGENGLLSASEASLLNLRGTELVVLSACETGKGEVKNSEGVYGLRKAFSDAGAANTIMSLWKVDDKVTQEFMTRFYEIWLNDKTTIREAFNRTQIEIKAKYPQPYYWGAFVLVGC